MWLSAWRTASRPEHPYPIPLDDAYDATCWAVENAVELGAGASPDLIVAGTSAGGNLAAGIAIRARESGAPRISCQALLYPCLDDALDTQSYSDCATGYFLGRDQMRWYWEQYLPKNADRSSPRAVPARCEDLSALPSALIATAEFDPLRDEGAEYARRLDAAGVVGRVPLLHGPDPRISGSARPHSGGQDRGDRDRRGDPFPALWFSVGATQEKMNPRQLAAITSSQCFTYRSNPAAYGMKILVLSS